MPISTCNWTEEHDIARIEALYHFIDNGSEALGMLRGVRGPTAASIPATVPIPQ
jgi:hypothetical protein